MENNDTILSDLLASETEVSVLQGFITRIIDFGLEMLILYFIYRYTPSHLILGLFEAIPFMGVIIVLTLVIAYQFFFLFLFLFLFFFLFLFLLILLFFCYLFSFIIYFLISFLLV